MFAMADLLIATAIESRLDFLRKNPHHLEFILCSNPFMVKYIGNEYIKGVVDYIQQNDISVVTNYDSTESTYPTIACISSGAEDQQFLGEYGHQIQTVDVSGASPVVYAEFNANSIDGNSMLVPRSSDVHLKLWPGIMIKNGELAYVIEAIIEKEGQDTVICLKEDLPDGTPVKGWKASSAKTLKTFDISSSMDEVDVAISLKSKGTTGLHRGLSMVLRYCLKSSRLWLEQQGYLKTQLSYTPMEVQNPTELGEWVIETTMRVSGSIKENWIHKEGQVYDNVNNVFVCVEVEDRNET